MKNLSAFLVILIIIGLAAIVTKPSDQQSIELLKSNLEADVANSLGNNIQNSFATLLTGKLFNEVKGLGLIRIEDKLFYKNIYFIPGNIKIGTTCFSTLIVDNDLQNNINNHSDVFNRNNNNIFPNNFNPSESVRNKLNQSEPVKKIKSLFKHKENNQVGSDLISLQNELNNAKTKLQELERFHLLRTSAKKNNQITQQEQYIQSLEEKIRELENQ